LNLSILPDTDHSTRTLTVSWNEAADNHDSVYNEIFVIPRSNLSAIPGFFPAFNNPSFVVLN